MNRRTVAALVLGFLLGLCCRWPSTCYISGVPIFPGTRINLGWSR